ncbi:Med12 domain-containing protein [Psidium guajava]|nr:Med12 domain-containing protein [Psidium guajava]
MQRYHVANCGSAVNNSSIGGPSSRDTARSESPALSSNSSLYSRRPYQISPYKLKCEKEPLNSRLGPPDYHPQTTDCPEETLTKEYVQSGYKETVEGLEEAKEISLSQVPAFGKPIVLKCKEAIRKRLRAINESRAQKRKAGQVYGVPLSGSLLNKSTAFPSEDFRKRWIEGLSQPHKRLRSLGEHVPHGYRKKSLFEVLIKNNVPILRATWFIKVTYLNQVRPGSAGISSGAPDRGHLSRSELWTKDVIDYLQNLLDEFRRNNYNSNSHLRERSPQMLYAGPTQQKGEAASSTLDGDEPSLHFKWWYMVRLLQWHHTEGLVLPSPIIDWVLSQLQDKELFETLQLLLPIIYAVVEVIVLSQTYVRTLVGVAVRFICEPSPGGSDLVDNSRREYTCSAVVEMLRYLILAVPDTFVALDCFPLPPNVVSHTVNDAGYLSKASEDIAKMEMGSAEVACFFRRKGFDAFYQAVSFGHVVSSIQRHADKLAKVVSSGNPSCGYAGAVQALDKALVHGDLKGTYKFLFEDVCEEAVDGGWIAEVSPCLRSSLKWIGSLKLSFIYSVFFLCEWATCDFRNSRTAPLADVKFSGRKDFSQVYVAVLFLKLKKRDLENQSRRRNDNVGGASSHKGLSQENNFGRTSMVNVFENGNSTENVDNKNIRLSGGFNSPGPLHDILVCWIDQHEVPKGEGFERLQLLIVELARCGIFNPPAYVRQLLISGIMGSSGHLSDRDRQMRHCRILKQLPGILIRDALEEARIADGKQFLETMHVYLSERRLVLQELYGERRNLDDAYSSAHKKKHYFRSSLSPTSVDQWKAVESPSGSFSPRKADIEEVNTLISSLMQFPNSVPLCMATDESEGSIKRTAGSICNKSDFTDISPGCEECRRVKKQKLTEERSAYIQVHSPIPSDDEDLWWMRKGPKSSESLKVDPPLKTTKQASRGRQKVVRKTQSLAQLAAARIEGSQGASTSHVCDSRTSCSHHGTGVDGEIPKSVDGMRVTHSCDVITVGKALKHLRIAKRRVVTVWLLHVVKQLIEEAEKTSAQVGQFNRTFTSLNDRSTLRWKLSEDELSNILYLLDVSDDLVSAVKLILWLLPKAFRTSSSAIHSGRNVLMLQRHAESHVCEIRETFLLSSLRRYESTLIAADLIPQALSASMDLVATVVASNGRVSGTSALAYARYLLKKYGNVTSVLEWRKTSKAYRDKRLLAELESGRPSDGEFGFPLGVPTGVDDLDDFFRQKMSTGRLSRVGMSMRDIVQRRVEEAFHFFSGKEKKVFAAGVPKGPSLEKGDDGFQISEQIVVALMECMRQTGGAAQEGDPSLVSSAISAIVGSIGPTLAKIPDFTAGGSYANSPSSTSSLNVARQILRINITCLCLLREALGERQSRVFEIALATEASSALAGVFNPGKSSRNQYQSAEAHDSNPSTSSVVGRATKVIAAVSALIIGAVIQGITSLERMVSVFRLKEGIDVVQFMRSIRSNSNGSIRSPGTFKVESPIEVHIHWFRLLVGNCRTVSDGLVVELLGEPSIVAISRMQQTLPIGLVFPPAYSIMAFLMWRPFILNSNLASREDMHQLYQSLSVAMSDALKHLPFRDVCLRDSVGLYDLVSADTIDSDFASMLELNGTDLHWKSIAFVPLRARLFLDAIISCRIPAFVTQDDRSRITGHGDLKDRFAENKTKLLDRIVHVLNTLQPAKFHWQWLELRLLLNEQALIEKLEAHDTTLVDAIRSLAPSSERAAVSENENNFIEIILTRLLVRPDAAPLFSEVVHLFGRSLQDSMLLLTKWFLEGHDVLFGRKTIRQRLMNIADSKGLSTKPQICKHWGWSTSGVVTIANNLDKKKHEVGCIEEGEVVEEGVDPKKFSKGSIQVQLDPEGYSARSMQQFATEKALIELVLPCIDQSSDESRNTFASDLIKQLNAIEQHISAIARVTSKNTGTATPGAEGPAGKSSNRKGMRGGSPGLARRQAAAAAVAADSAPPSPAALRASISLRLHFLLRLLPIICADREPLGRNMRHMLAFVILRLLGNQLVYDYADLAIHPLQTSPCKREGELPVEAPGHNAPSNFLGETLFDRLLLVLHGLLSSSQPSWLKPKLTSKSAPEYIKDFAGIDKEAAENLLNELDNMQLPDKIRWRIQAAMPFLLPSVRCSVSCQPPSVPVAALTTIQSTISFPGASSGNLNPMQRNPVSSARSSTTATGKSRGVAPQQDYNIEVDAWTLLEDGVGGGPSSSGTAGIGGADSANLRAASWLKGAVRVRRADLTYVGAVDDES